MKRNYHWQLLKIIQLCKSHVNTLIAYRVIFQKINGLMAYSYGNNNVKSDGENSKQQTNAELDKK